MTEWRKVLRQVAPHADAAILAGVLKTIDAVFAKNGLTTVARQSDFLAHVLVESAGLTKVEENLNYSAGRLRQVWPSRFRSDAAAEACAHNPKALALVVYGGRMGNRPGTDDGWTYRGSGLLQCTGRDNVQRLAHHCGISTEECADWLRDPDHALECAAALYVMLGALPYADRGDIAGSTQRVNGGQTGIAERKRARDLLKLALSQSATVVGFLSTPEDEAPAATAGQIIAAQRLLREKGYWSAGAPDGVMGPATESALVHFQADNGLAKTGALDPATMDALYTAAPRALPDSRTEATEDDLRAKGSQTLEKADAVQSNAAKMIGISGVGAASAGVDLIAGVNEKIAKVNDTLTGWEASKAFIADHWMAAILLVGAALLVWWAWENRGASKLIRHLRLADHRCGAHMGR